MRRLGIAVGVTMMLVAGLAAHRAFADISGTWRGDMRMEPMDDGGMGRVIKSELDVKQDGDKLTGKFGDIAKPDEMMAIAGTVNGDEVSLTVKPDDNSLTITFALKVSGTHLKGKGEIQMAAATGVKNPVTPKPSPFTIDLQKK